MPVGSRRTLLNSVALPAPPIGGGGGPTSTLNPSTTPTPGTSSNISVTSGNLLATATDNAVGHAVSLGVVPPGSLTYVEVTITARPNLDSVAIGLCNASKLLGPGSPSWVGGDPPNCMGLYDGQTVFKTDGFNVNDPNLILTAGDTIGMQIDDTAHTMQFRKGSYLSATFACPPGSIYLYIELDNTGAAALANTGGSAFVYAANISTGFIGRIT